MKKLDLVAIFEEQEKQYQLIKNTKLPDKFIEQYKDELNWTWISKYQNLSEEQIRKYKDRIDWITLSVYWDLPEKFIIKYRNRISWGNISLHQKLSERFIIKHIDRLDIFNLLHNKRIKFTKDLLKFLLFKSRTAFEREEVLKKLREIEQ